METNGNGHFEIIMLSVSKQIAIKPCSLGSETKGIRRTIACGYAAIPEVTWKKLAGQVKKLFVLAYTYQCKKISDNTQMENIRRLRKRSVIHDTNAIPQYRAKYMISYLTHKHTTFQQTAFCQSNLIESCLDREMFCVCNECYRSSSQLVDHRTHCCRWIIKQWSRITLKKYSQEKKITLVLVPFNQT